MTIIDGIYFGDQEYTSKEIQDILKHKKKKKFSITVIDALEGKR